MFTSLKILFFMVMIGAVISACNLDLAPCYQCQNVKAIAWATHPIGSPPLKRPALRRAILTQALDEWKYFGRQTIRFHGSNEIISQLGVWEDDDYRHSERVGQYWNTVGMKGVKGIDCQEPWSAAFISWVMQTAGVPAEQFTPAPSHWIYLAQMIDQAATPGRYFIPRRVREYSPHPGDLICAYRGNAAGRDRNLDVSANMLQDTSTHCDLVITKNRYFIETIGGNVRNSVSRCTFELDTRGHLLAIPRRPWFLILENRL